MKQFNVLLIFLIAMVTAGYGQVAVGEGTDVLQAPPINAYYNYSYSQSIYLASEINASGSITSIKWYYNGSSPMTKSQGLTIYLGQTDKTEFTTNVDYVPLVNLTSVYTGGIVTGSSAGWKTITFTTPFAYDGIANLVVAVDENMAGYDSSNTDKFRNTAVESNRSIFAYADGVNPDPANPGAGSPTRGMVAFVPNIIFGGITQACGNTSALTTSQVGITNATIGWTAAVGQTDWQVYVVEQGNDAPTSSTVGTAVTGTPTFLKTDLGQNTVYSVYVRAKCSDQLYSSWTGPKNFRTLCDSFGDFTENFDGIIAGPSVLPDCWIKTISSTNSASNIAVSTGSIVSTPNCISMTNTSDAAASMFLVTPSLISIGANTHRIKFQARSLTNGQSLIVGTMSDPADPSTFVELQSFALSLNFLTYSVTLNTSTTANHIAFKHGLGGTYRTIYIDDVVWEAIPPAPSCVVDVEAITNEGCGNLATLITWPAVPYADGYTVSIGSSANGQDLIVNNVNIYSALSYSFIGNPQTTYYYTVKPYNASGPAVDCDEISFNTYEDGCYCVSVPSSNDGLGITNVQVGNSNFTVADVTYADFTESDIVTVTQGVNTIMNITLATGYSYFTEIWIDYNNNFTFEPSELVYSGQAASAVNPYITTASFTPANTANLGQHRMRVVSTRQKTIPANSCYNGTFGVTLDFNVNVLTGPTCWPPTASTASQITGSTAKIDWVSNNTSFNIEVDFAGFTQGTGTFTSVVTGTSTILTNLSPQMDYAYYIQTNCGNGDLSQWAGPFTFRTTCGSYGNFTEDFTTDTTIPAPECWFTIKQTNDQYAYVQDNATSDYMQFWNFGDAAAVLYLITPELTALPLGTHTMKFKAKSNSTNYSLVVGTMSDPTNATTFTAVQTIPVTNTFENYSVVFANATTNTHVAFRFIGNAQYQYLYLDDMVWEPAPTCPDVNVVDLGQVTSNTAAISWVPGSTETAWQYVYGSVSVTDPSTLTPYEVTPTPSTIITDLTPNTSYKVWVRATCGTLFGAYSDPITFTTACAPVATLPWTESFENIIPDYNTFPACWSKQNGNFATAAANATNSPRTGLNYLRNSDLATNEFMWSPAFTLTAGVSYDYSFYMQGDGFTGWNVDVFQNTLQNSTNATQLGATITASGSGSSAMQAYEKVSRTFTPTTTGNYYFAIRVNQSSFEPDFIAFDDFRMELTPTCVAPSAPTASNVTVATATINWIESTPVAANGYDYYFSNTAIAPDDTTTPSGTVGAGITTADLTGLNGSTIYKIYVRSICATNVNSGWSEAGIFTTICVNATLPYSINFENATVPNLPLCTTIQNASNGNNWQTVMYPGYGFTSKVLKYAYASSAANAWFYTNTFNLVAGTNYTVSYNYGNDSSVSYSEKLKVAYGLSAIATAMTTELANHTSINQAEIQSNLVNFTPTVTGTYVIGFNAYSNASQSSLYLDNIVIQENLGTLDFENNSFTAYPNPVKDRLNFSFTQNISNVAVYNLLGQQVLFMNMNANKGQVDMSTLTPGTYLVKVTAENRVKSMKVIKE